MAPQESITIPATDSDALHVANINAGYKNRKIIHDISLSPIQPGMVTVIIGPNGAGKSTFIRTIAGLLPAQGSLLMNEKDLLKMSIRDRAEIVSYMPQTQLGELELTVLEALIDAGHIQGHKDSKELEEQALSLLSNFELIDIALSPLSGLSGGQRQMVSFAQVLIGPTKIYLFDEPINALDLRRQEQVMSYIQKLASTGAIVLVVLHDLSLAARWADRVIALNNGQIVADAPPIEAINETLLQTLYGVNAKIAKDDEGTLRIHIDGLYNKGMA